MPDNVIEGVGEHFGWQDVRGWLTFSALPDELQRQEDQTANADYERRGLRRVGPEVWRRVVEVVTDDGGVRVTRPWVRPATDAERVLLAHLGFNLPSMLETYVSYPSGGVRRREWPALVKQQEAMA